MKLRAKMKTKNLILRAKVFSREIDASIINMESDFQLGTKASGMWLYAARDNARKLISVLDTIEKTSQPNTDGKPG